MGKHYILSDLHHGSYAAAKYLDKKAAKEGKLHVSSTGDQAVYAANDRAPPELNHLWVKAYKKGDKAGMQKYEADWIKSKVIPYTKSSGRTLQTLKPHLEGGKIDAIYGNSDYAVGGMTKKAGGGDIKDLLGGKQSAVRQTPYIRVKKQDNTTFVYLPHDPHLLSKYQNKDYKDVKARLSTDKNYQERLKRMQGQISRNNSKNIVVLMHESPSPERWYGKGTKKSKSRLPDALKAHYDSVLEQIAQNKTKGAKGTIFHGHLHESNKKHYTYNGFDTNLLDIGDIVDYDTVKGAYKIEHVKAEIPKETKTAAKEKEPKVVEVDFKKKHAEKYKKAA